LIFYVAHCRFWTHPRLAERSTTPWLNSFSLSEEPHRRPRKASPYRKSSE
jgi:hypothetical protein